MSQELGIDEAEIEARKQWLQFTEEDARRLQALNKVAHGYTSEVIEELYRHILATEKTASFFKDPEVLERVKALQKKYFLQLTEGPYGGGYVDNRLNIGAVHGRIGLDVKWYLGAYCFYLRTAGSRIFEAFPDKPDEARAAFFSLMKLVFLDIGLAVDTYIHSRERTIRQQQEAIQELSTPVLQVRDRMLILPIVGVVDTHRAKLITEHLLHEIRARRARVVILDITGVPAVDSRVANHLLQTVEAARLMGAQAIITGLSAEVAQALVTLGVDLGNVRTVGDLQGGIEEAERLLGRT